MIDLFDTAFLNDPHPTFEILRRTAPVEYVESIDAYLVTSHELVSAVLADPHTYSNRRDSLGTLQGDDLRSSLAEIRQSGWSHRPTIADEDPPRHDAFRSIVAPFFTPSRMRPFRPAMERVCHDLVDRWNVSRPIDFVEEFATPLPLRAVAILLDLPADDFDDQLATFARWRDAAVVSVGTDATDAAVLDAEHAVVEMQHYLARRIESAGDPEDDIFAALRDTQIEDTGRRRRLTMEEMLSVARQVFVGGIETTTKALAEAMLQLDGRPDLFAALRENDQRRRVVEESLRLSSPAQGIVRVTTSDVVLGGWDIPAGSRLFVMYASANRDGSALRDPELLDPDRAAVAQHLAFGRGVHVCLGAAFARAEMQVALGVLAERIESYRVIDRECVSYPPSFVLRGPLDVRLRVELTRGASRS